MHSVNSVFVLYRTGNMQSAILSSFVASSSFTPCELQSTHLWMPCYISPYVVYKVHACDWKFAAIKKMQQVLSFLRGDCRDGKCEPQTKLTLPAPALFHLRYFFPLDISSQYDVITKFNFAPILYKNFVQNSKLVIQNFFTLFRNFLRILKNL